MLCTKKYGRAVKCQALKMILRGGKTVMQTAKELGVSQYSIFDVLGIFSRSRLPEAASVWVQAAHPGYRLQ
jgi:transposase-like protein